MVFKLSHWQVFKKKKQNKKPPEPGLGKSLSFYTRVEGESVTDFLEFSLTCIQSFKILHFFGPCIFTFGNDS